MEPVRTRFAPSPTGYLHVGGIRTALFAWLLARQTNGQFILRIEDTDQKRLVEGADRHIIDSLAQLGLDIDEGPVYQSQRVKDGVYSKWAQKLIDSGRAYADPYTPQEVQRFREQAQAEKRPFLYREHRPENTHTWDGTTPLRFKSEPKEYERHDMVMGDLHTGPEVIDDFILVKSDGYPTYNFAHIVDDAEMEITHVLRAQEFLASIPNYLNLYEALEITPPAMATLPPIMSEQGNKKLSKRDGAKDVLDYTKDGYPAEALISFIATLGWNDGSEQEVFTRQELIEKFSLDRVQKSGAQFDNRRLDWVSGSIIRQMPLDDLYIAVKDFWPDKTQAGEDYKKQVLGLTQERLKYYSELPKLTEYFFIDLPINNELIATHKQLKKLPADELKSLLEQVRSTIDQGDFSADDLQVRLNQLLEATGQKPAVLLSLIRIATTQSPSSPGLAETMEVLGKETCLRRIDAQIAAL